MFGVPQAVSTPDEEPPREAGKHAIKSNVAAPPVASLLRGPQAPALAERLSQEHVRVASDVALGEALLRKARMLSPVGSVNPTRVGTWAETYRAGTRG